MEDQIKVIKKIKKWYRRKIVVIPIIIFLVVIVLFLFLNKDKNLPKYETTKVILGNLEQTVDATGNIESADEIDLRFESMGKINFIYKNINEEVKKGDLLMELENSDEQARYSQSIASLARAQANLQKVLTGQTDSYIGQLQARLDQAEANLNQTKAVVNDNISNASSVVATSENNLKLAEGGENSTIVKNAYENLLAQIQVSQDSVSSALTKADNILGVDDKNVNDSFEDYLSTLDSSKIILAKEKYLVAKDARDDIDQKVANIIFEKFDYKKIKETADAILLDLNIVKDMLVTVSQMLNYTVAVGNLSQTELDTMKSNIQLARSDISANNASLIRYVQAVDEALNSYESYKIAWEKAKINLENIKLKSEADIASYEALYNQALASFEDANNPAREEDIMIARSSVSEAEAAVNQAISNLNKKRIYAPVDGIIGKINVKVGEYVASTNIVGKVISPHFEIKVAIPETDIVKIKIGDEAQITLDAYGDDIKFLGKVLEIEQGQTVIQDVIYYNVTVSMEISKEQETYNIFNGMTADVLFFTEKKENVLYIPQRVIISEGNKKNVRILENSEVKDMEVSVGLKADNGFVEILDGLKENEEVIIRTLE